MRMDSESQEEQIEAARRRENGLSYDDAESSALHSDGAKRGELVAI